MSLSKLEPYVGSAHYYLYEGGPREQYRIGNCYAFHLFSSAGGKVSILDQTYHVKAGDLFFIRPREAHAFHATKNESMPAYNIYADLWGDNHPISAFPKFQYPDDQPSMKMTPHRACDELDALPSYCSLQPFNELTDHFIQMIKLLNRKSKYNQSAVHFMFHAWMLRWYDCLTSHGPSDSRIVSLLTWLEQEEGLITVDHMSERCKLGRTRFFSLFREETGMTPNEYLLQQKMKRASALLKEGQSSVTEVAEKLHYSSIHYFSRQFSDYYGMNPSMYRVR